MNTTPALGKAKAYLDIESRWTSPNPTRWTPGEDGPFITVSREAGSGGSTFATTLVQDLDARRNTNGPRWTLFDKDLVGRVLSDANLPGELARYLPEDRIPAVVSSIGEIVGLHPDLWTLVSRTNQTVRRLAIMGHTVIVGRGANFATAGLAHGLNIRLVGSLAVRAERVASAQQCALRKAMALTRKIDAARRDYVNSAFERDVRDNCAYDLIINTDLLTMREAVDVVLALLSRRGILRGDESLRISGAG